MIRRVHVCVRVCVCVSHIPTAGRTTTLGGAWDTGRERGESRTSSIPSTGRAVIIVS